MADANLAPRDAVLVELLDSIHPAAREGLAEARAIQGAIGEFGVRVGLAEILVDRGVLPADAFVAACRAAAERRIGLVDRSSMRHLNVAPEEDANVVQVAVNYGLLEPAERDEAAALEARIAAIGGRVLMAKILADRSVLDVEIYEGLLRYLRRFQGQAGPAGPEGALPFDEEDLVLGVCGQEAGVLDRVQIVRGLKIRLRFRKVGIEKNLIEILFEQGQLDEATARALAETAGPRLQAPRPIALQLLFLRPDQVAALEVERAAGRLVAAISAPQLEHVRGQLAATGIQRSPARLAIDLGLAASSIVETIRRTPPPAAPPPAPIPGPARVPAPHGTPSAPSLPVPAPCPPTIVAAPAPPPAPRPGPASHRSNRRRGREPGVASSSAQRARARGEGGTVGVVLVCLAVVLTLGSIGAIVAVALGAGGEPVEVAEPVEVDLTITDEAVYRDALAAVDASLAEGYYGQGLELARALEPRVATRVTWRIEVSKRVERAERLVEFMTALVALCNERQPVRLEEPSWRKYEIRGADPETLRVVKDGSTGESVMRWERLPPRALARLALALGVGERAPMATLHYVIQCDLDESIRRQGALCLAEQPDRRAAVLDLVGGHLGVDGERELVVAGDRILTRSEQASGAVVADPTDDEPEDLSTFEGTGPADRRIIGAEPDREPDAEPDRRGLVEYRGRWVTPAEKERLENEARGLVRHEGRWVTPAERDRLENQADGLVEFEGRWMTPEEREEIEQERRGLVRVDGRWVTREEADRLENQADGLVLFEGEWVTPEERSRLQEARRMEGTGKVYFRGRWVAVQQKAILEDIVQDPDPEDYHESAVDICRIALPKSDRWSYQARGTSPLGAGNHVFTIVKTSPEGEQLVSMTCVAFSFSANYSMQGRGWQETVGGDNPSGLLRVHRRYYEERTGGAIVRVKMKKDFFHKDMHAFWCHLDYRDRTTIKIYSLTSNLRIANRGYVIVAEFGRDQYAISGLGVDSMLKTLSLMDKNR